MSKKNRSRHQAPASSAPEVTSAESELTGTVAEDAQIDSEPTQELDDFPTDEIDSPHGLPIHVEAEPEEVKIVPVPSKSITRADMEAQGFVRTLVSACRCGITPGCGQSVEHWSGPKGRTMIVNPMPNPDSPWLLHAEICPAVPRKRV